jgi:hypothetical protein
MAPVRLNKQTTFFVVEVQIVGFQTWCLFGFCLVFVCCLMSDFCLFDVRFHTNWVIKQPRNNGGLLVSWLFGRDFIVSFPETKLPLNHHT